MNISIKKANELSRIDDSFPKFTNVIFEDENWELAATGCSEGILPSEHKKLVEDSEITMSALDSE